MTTPLFADKTAAGQKLLVPYLCAGFPDPASTLDVLHALADAGADAIELGIPFSDPLMDGPVIQDASQQALDHGMTLATALDIAEKFTASNNTPLLLMSSINPVLAMGAQQFTNRAADARIAGCILPDLPPENAGLLPDAPPLVPLVAPNTPDDRITQVATADVPFVYAISILGVTGTRTNTADYTQPFLRRVTNTSAAPVLAGFGISTPDQAATSAAACHGVIIGSALIKHLATATNPATAAGDFLTPFRNQL